MNSEQIEAISQDTHLTIGEFYNVKCAILQNRLNDRLITFIPVIGIIHSDTFAEHVGKHIHIDSRFWNAPLRPRALSSDADADHHQHKTGEYTQVIGVGENRLNPPDMIFKGFTVKRLECIRLFTGIPSHQMADNIPYVNWYSSFVGKSCKGKKCPHLGTTMLERDGELVCPLHDLRGDCTTEKITPFPLQHQTDFLTKWGVV